ncbi:helix-turn-helix domain-containing protein [Solibacillus ferritrahens]|uniref:helix-turn-helix domain-containing protein n=1 Tax=Solibacillus ferritrahens TaxID=3098620 RepID=UPI003009EC0A
MRKIRIKLSEILEERGLKQSQLAEMADVRPNAISNLCRGYVDRLSIEHLEKISDALQLASINELIELENDKKDA